MDNIIFDNFLSTQTANSYSSTYNTFLVLKKLQSDQDSKTASTNMALSQIQALEQQIRDSENNLKAQYEVLMQQQQVILQFKNNFYILVHDKKL